ncbi:MAG TPA: LamG domain-containing protein [Kofleriaceae bacterium]
MRSAWVVAFTLVAACGRFGFGEQSDTTDAAIDTVTGHAYRAAVIADSPLGYWRLADEGSTAHDEIGQFDGTIIGTCLTTAGALSGDLDRAMVFDGTSCMISLGDHFAFSGDAPFSIEAWYTSVAGGDAFRHIFTREDRNTGPVDGYALALDDNGSTPNIFVERVVASAGISTMRVVPAAGFSHGVAVYDEDTLALYIDGVEVFTTPDARPMTVFAAVAYIGAAPDIPRNNFFHGTLDEIAIYDHALSPERIQLHHQLGLSGP